MAKKLPKEVSTIQEHVVRKIDYSKEKNVSASQLLVFNDCQHRWKLAYVDKLSTYTPSIHTVFGTSLHEVVQHWLGVIYNQSAKAAQELNLRQLLKEKIREVYAKERAKAKEDFTTPQELNSFFLDGVEILTHLQKKRSTYFSTKGVYLVGVELELVQEIKPGILFKGFIDVVFFDSNTNRYLILDIKTSTKGWSDYEKKNEAKIAQILLYKEFFAKQFNTSVDNLDVEFFITRRKIIEGSDFTPKRIQQWVPASGPIKRKKALKLLEDFVNRGFIEGGQYNKDGVFPPNPSPSTCKFCEFKKSGECAFATQ